MRNVCYYFSELITRDSFYILQWFEMSVSTRLGQSRPFHGYTPSKHSNNQPGQGLLQTFLIWKAITTSSLDLKFFYCPMHYPKVS